MTSTDALRLVPIDMQIESILHDLVQEVSAAQRGAQAKRRSRQCCARGAAKNAILNALSAAPASPLPEGGGQCSGITGELKSQDLDALEKLADDRAMVLDACADLFEEIAAFMDGMIGKTYQAYDEARDKPELNSLMRKHRQALSIRDDYKGLARENREDAEIYRAFLARNGKGEG